MGQLGDGSAVGVGVIVDVTITNALLVLILGAPLEREVGISMKRHGRQEPGLEDLPR